MSSCPIVTSRTTVAGSIAEGVKEWSDDTDLESDDEMDFDVVQRLFVRGNEYFKEARFAEAAKFFDAGVNRTQALSYSRQSSLRLDKIRSKLGSSYAELDLRRAYDSLQEGNLDESERVFRELVGQQFGKVDEVRRRKLHASSGMAHIDLSRQNLGAAEGWCKKSSVEWKRLVGKTYPLHLASLKLMQSIYEAKGDLATATILSDIAIETPATTGA